MKLFVVAVLLSVAAAGRLEHLERSYLPPDNNGQQSFSSSRGFQNTANSFGIQEGSPSSQNSISSQGGFQNGAISGFRSSVSGGINSFGSDDQNSNGFHSSKGVSGFNNGRFGAATSNQYLPPNNGPSGFLSNGFGRSAVRSNFGSPSIGADSRFGSSNSQYNAQSQFGAAASRQYLTPRASPSIQSGPQQAFDEVTGYQY